MHDGIGPLDQALECRLVQKVAQHQVGGDSLERRQGRPAAHQQAETEAATGQGSDEMGADEAGDASDRDQLRHGTLLRRGGLVCAIGGRVEAGQVVGLGARTRELA
jgi:hypothetical protein